MCCKLLRIVALDKPRSQWCRHCDIGVGCKIYSERPEECRLFDCGYVTQAGIGEHWRPSRSKMVIALSSDASRLTIFVDPDRGDAWRKDPFLRDIKGWARLAAKNGSHVVVSAGADVTVVEPDREIKLGPVGDNQMIISRRKRGAASGEAEHIVVDRDDPVLDALRLLQDPSLAEMASPEQRAEAQRQVDAWLARRNARD